MAYDIADGYYLLFGGYTGTNVYSDTWKFTPAKGWSELSPSNSPQGLASASMAYDAKDSTAVLFGGCPASLTCPVADTYTYSGGTWSQYTSGSEPTGSIAAGMAYDTADGYVVMFGGCSDVDVLSSECDSGDFLSDTWTFDTSSGWKEITSTKTPPVREAPNMAYDPALNEVLLYGGYNGANALSDMWAYSAGQWTQLSPATSPGPLSGSAMFWDPGLDEMIMYGGTGNSGDVSTTWAYSNGNWAKLSTVANPGARDSMMVASPPSGEPILFGGNVNNNTQADTWMLGVPVGVQATAGPQAVDVGQPVSFTAVASGGQTPYTYSWTLGDGNTSPSANLTHSYSTAGNFTATVTVSDGFGLTANQTYTVHVSPLPKVGVQASRTNVTLGTKIQFWANVTGGTAPLSYLWNFGDATNSTIAAPVHNFTSPGNYTVTVSVTDNASASARGSIVVNVNRPVGSLVVTFTALPKSGTAPLLVNFTSSVSGGTGGYVYNWNFDDGSPISHATDPSHEFNASKFYSVVLLVTDSSGHNGSYAFTINVSAGPMSLTLSASPLSGPAPLNVSFVATPIGGELPYSYHWVFGDGSSASGVSNVTHVYNSSGPFNASVTVSDNPADGKSETKSVSITVVEPLTVSIFTATSVDPGAVDTFNANASGGTSPYNYTWSFGDGSSNVNTGSVNTTTHTYSSSGTYTVYVYVTDSMGLKANISRTISVSQGSTAPSTNTSNGGGGSAIFGNSDWLAYLLVPAILYSVLTLFMMNRKGRDQDPPRQLGPPPQGMTPPEFKEPSYYPSSAWR